MRRSAALATLLLALAAVGPARGEESSLARALAEQVRVQAQRALPPDWSLVEVALPRSLQALEALPSAVAVHWRQAPRPGRISAQVALRGADGQERVAWVRLEIRELRPVVVAARPLQAGARIDEGDLAVADRPIERGQGWQLDPTSLLGAVVLRDTAAGELIEGDKVEEPAPVPRGMPIAVVVRKGRVLIRTKGALQRASRPGEVAPVRLDGTGLLIQGRLVTRDMILIEGVGR